MLERTVPKEMRGLATGIGSLPHTDPQEAVDLVFKYLPEIPFWPQLPKRSPKEGMLAQFSENLPCLRMTGDGLIFEGRRQEEELEAFYGKVIEGDLEYFKIGRDFAAGLYSFYDRLKKSGAPKGMRALKCHITGPFSFAASINDEREVALLHEPTFMQVIIKALAMKALWQIKLLKEFSDKIIVFIDEPYLAAFGSAYTPVNREDVLKAMTELTGEIKSQGVLTGVHCCGNTDWSVFTDIESLDIINFDAFGFLERFVLYAENLSGFLKRGGVICWGIVPTQDFSEAQSADLLVQKIIAGIDLLAKKGLDRRLLLDNLLVSPSCGLGTLYKERSGKIFALLSETSALIRKTPKNKLFDNRA